MLPYYPGAILYTYYLSAILYRYYPSAILCKYYPSAIQYTIRHTIRVTKREVLLLLIAAQSACLTFN